MRDKEILLLLLVTMCLSTAIAGNDAMQVYLNMSKNYLIAGDDFYLILTFANIGEIPQVTYTQSQEENTTETDIKIRELRYKVRINDRFQSGEDYVGYNFPATNYTIIGDLGPGATVHGVIPLHIKEGAEEGDYEVTVKTTYKDSNNTISNTTHDFLVGIGKPLDLLKIKTVSTSNASPGEELELKIVLESDRDVENIEVNLEPVIGVTLKNDVALRKIKKLKEGEEELITYNLITSQQTGAGITQLPVIMKYLYNGKVYYKEVLTGLDVKGKAELSLTNVETAPSQPLTDLPFNMRLEIENTGTANAENITINLITNLEGIKKKFSNSIKPGNFGEVVFNLQTRNESDAGIKNIILEVEYDDEIGHHVYREELQVEILLSLFNEFFIFIIILGSVITVTIIYYLVLKKK